MKFCVEALVDFVSVFISIIMMDMSAGAKYFRAVFTKFVFYCNLQICTISKVYVPGRPSSLEAWCLYHKTFTAVIYGFRNKLECLSLNT